ncbi:MAG: hypothetical protein HUU60_05430 [Armatimonadetes bacterium]|nr:hypothetical protein [Armatimonadota bacterium]
MIQVGNVRLTAQWRRFGGDEGVDLQIHVQQNGTWREAIRFDCFLRHPHYHLDPYGHERILDIADPDPLGWSLKQIETQLPELLAKAGYANVEIEQDELTAAFPKIVEMAEAANR